MSPPSQTPSAGGPSRRRRAFYRLTKETAVLLDNVRRFCEGERVAGRAYSLSNPVSRTARATGVSERSVLHVRDDDFFESLAVTGDRETQARGSRTSPAERACVRDAVYQQYENRSLPTVDSTLEYLTTAAKVHAATGKWLASYDFLGPHIAVSCYKRFSFSFCAWSQPLRRGTRESCNQGPAGKLH